MTIAVDLGRKASKQTNKLKRPCAFKETRSFLQSSKIIIEVIRLILDFTMSILKSLVAQCLVGVQRYAKKCIVIGKPVLRYTWYLCFCLLQVSPVTTRRLGSTNLIRDIRGTRTNEFRRKKSKKKNFFFFFFLILGANAETS